MDREVLFFRDQRLDDDGQVGLGRRIGELTASHPVVGGVDAEHPGVYALHPETGRKGIFVNPGGPPVTATPVRSR